MNEFVGASRNVVRAGIALILVVGLIHLVEAPEYFEVATYVGLLFLANVLGAAISAYWIHRGAGLGWVLGALVAGGAFVAYVVSRTLGLPGAPGLAQESIFEPLGLASLVAEALFMALYMVRAGRRASTA